MKNSKLNDYVDDVSTLACFIGCTGGFILRAKEFAKMVKPLECVGEPDNEFTEDAKQLERDADLALEYWHKALNDMAVNLQVRGFSLRDELESDKS